MHAHAALSSNTPRQRHSLCRRPIIPALRYTCASRVCCVVKCVILDFVCNACLPGHQPGASATPTSDAQRMPGSFVSDQVSRFEVVDVCIITGIAHIVQSLPAVIQRQTLPPDPLMLHGLQFVVSERVDAGRIRAAPSRRAPINQAPELYTGAHGPQRSQGSNEASIGHEAPSQSQATQRVVKKPTARTPTPSAVSSLCDMLFALVIETHHEVVLPSFTKGVAPLPRWGKHLPITVGSACSE